ncbi:MAG: hypothetical protein LBV19_06175 [Streptococcaceae bacterium]|jgi:hypothetical protein|nr:hypothetical protein [Streptococcaceae bacterium]
MCESIVPDKLPDKATDLRIIQYTDTGVIELQRHNGTKWLMWKRFGTRKEAQAYVSGLGGYRKR